MRKLNIILITSVLVLGLSSVQADTLNGVENDETDISDGATTSSWWDHVNSSFIGAEGRAKSRKKHKKEKEERRKKKEAKKKREKAERLFWENRAMIIYNSNHGLAPPVILPEPSSMKN